MKTIAIANQKGGVGKTTTACNMLFDELPDATGIELTQFVRSLPQHAHMPVIVVKAVCGQA